MQRRVHLLSVVIPCHNEEEVLVSTRERLTAVLSDLVSRGRCTDYELVLVDNGSTDNTADVMQRLFEKDGHVQVIALRRNFGYQGSISAGLAHARGDAVVTIDADMQDPPEKIEEMIGHYERGFDLVLGVRAGRSADSFLKRCFAQSYYRLLRALDVDVVYNHGDFRLMARGLVDEFNELSERNRFIRAMILKLESRYAVVHYDRQARREGRTKFGPRALLSLSIDGITSFTISPLRLATFVGCLMCVAALGATGWVIYVKVTTKVLPGWTSTLLPILVFSGFQLVFLGLIGEYIGQLYLEVKRRPLYSVRRRLSHGSDEPP